MDLNMSVNRDYKKLNYKDLIIFLIPFITFLFYLYIYNPGILSVDSFSQLHQIATSHFSNWHPFFHTFIEMMCLYIYPDPKSICLLQIFIFSIFWMIICKYNRADDTKFDKHFIFQVVFTLIISLIPINAIFSITLWKDILFSYFLMFLCFLMEVMITRNKDMSYKFAFVIAITMAIISQLRHNGLIVVIVLMLILGIYLFKKNKDKKFYIVIPALTVIFILLISSLIVVYDVQNSPKDVVYDKTTHILAFYDLNVDMDDVDRKMVHELITEKDIKEHFRIISTDYTYGVANKTAFGNNKASYIELAVKYSLKNPFKFAEYMFESSNIIWDITIDGGWEEYETNIEPSKNKYFNTYNITPAASYDDASSKNIGTQSYENLDNIVNLFKSNKILDTLFNSPALYMYLSLIIMGLIFIVTRSKEVLLIYLPNLLNIITVAISIPFQSVRYVYPNLLVFYLLVIIFIGIIFNIKKIR